MFVLWKTEKHDEETWTETLPMCREFSSETFPQPHKCVFYETNYPLPLSHSYQFNLQVFFSQENKTQKKNF